VESDMIRVGIVCLFGSYRFFP